MKRIYAHSIAMVVTLGLLFSAATQAETSKYRLSLRDDPAHSMVIGWCQDSGRNPTVHYGPEDHGQNVEEYAQEASPDREVSFRKMEHRFVRLRDLQADTAYYFVIRDSNSVSRRLWFRTTPSEGGPIHFLAGGDSRSIPRARRKANRMVSRLCADFVAFAGDFTAHGGADQWAQWLEDWQLTIADDGRMTPVVAARGNHEPGNEHLYNIFDLPNKENYYAIPFGENFMRLYTLNTHIKVRGKQTRWFKEDLQRHRDVLWKVAQYHKPIRPHTKGKQEGDRVYEAWAELFHSSQVKLAVECDSHMCKITWPVRPAGEGEAQASEGFVRDDAGGTVFVGEGTWGAPLRPANDGKPWTRGLGSFKQMKWIRVTRQNIKIRTVRYDNVKEVGAVQDDNPWVPPEGINLWTLPDGAQCVVVPACAPAPVRN